MPDETIAVNRRARHDYAIEDTLEAGIVLTGTEIKSVRAHKVNIAEAYVRIERGEAWLIGAHIAEYAQGNRNNHAPDADAEAAAPSRPDRRAARAPVGQGPDARPAAAVPPSRQREARGRRGARQEGRTTSADRSPSATCDASSSASQKAAGRIKL